MKNTDPAIVKLIYKITKEDVDEAGKTKADITDEDTFGQNDFENKVGQREKLKETGLL